MPKYSVIDFETYGIEDRPDYPPVPCGVAIQVGPSRKYYSWGHDTENNCTRAEGIKALRSVWKSTIPIFHNAAFDIDVAVTHCGLPYPTQFEDTLILAYLHDPRDDSLSLKPLAESYLDLPPEEQDRLKDWILENVPEAKRKPSSWGAYIQRAPGNLAAPYAKGDVLRTWKLFHFFMEFVADPDSNMLPAYAREKDLIAVKLKMEQGGIRGHRKKLEKDIPKFEECFDAVNDEIRERLSITEKWERENCKIANKKTSGRFNPGSGPQLAKALKKSGKVTKFIMTEPSKKFPEGQPSTSRENLEKVIKDKRLKYLLGVYGILSNYLSTFLHPWHQSVVHNDGYIFPSFNTIRSTDEYGGTSGFGTRTGRLSSSNPNFQNIPASVEGSAHSDILIPLREDLKTFGINLIGLRDYLIPDEGHVFLNRDYSQQEFRIAAHYEDGALLHRYLKNPHIDFHDLVRIMVYEATGMDYPRKVIKNINFGILYGMGALNLANRIGSSKEEAADLKRLILEQIPGIKDLIQTLKKMAWNDEPFRTYGGRMYWCEEPKIIKGKKYTFEYKMLNLLIQGSAADATKQGMLQVDDALQSSRLVLQVHDELHVSAPKGSWKQEMKRMKEAMEDLQFDLPLPTEGKKGAFSWARMSKVA